MDKHTAAHLILNKALPHIVFDGWTLATLSRAATEAGYSASELTRVFPRGVADALDVFAHTMDAQMLAAYHALPAAPEKIRTKIATLVRLRLEAMAPHREAVRRTLALYALPLHTAQGIRTLARTMSTIWYAAGDTATDFNWYTKRTLLAGVYSSTLLFWLNDTSPDHTATWAFLDRRIADVMKIQQWKLKTTLFRHKA